VPINTGRSGGSGHPLIAPERTIIGSRPIDDRLAALPAPRRALMADTYPARSSPMKRISPAQHAVLDYGVAATFFMLGFRYRRRNKAAAVLAFINGGMVLGMSMLTDYPGGIWRRISFKTHRTLDAVQAGLTAFGPVALGFGNAPEAKTFYSQATSEVGVIAMTDWDAGARA